MGVDSELVIQSRVGCHFCPDKDRRIVELEAIIRERNVEIGANILRAEQSEAELATLRAGMVRIICPCHSSNISAASRHTSGCDDATSFCSCGSSRRLNNISSGNSRYPS